jgi:hypothetical protein
MSLFSLRWSDNDEDAGAIGLFINCFPAYQVQQSLKSLHRVIRRTTDRDLADFPNWRETASPKAYPFLIISHQ